MRSAVGMEEGAVRSGMDRYEELTCEGEKPLTTLVVLLSDVALVEDDACDPCADCSDPASEVKEVSTGSTISGVAGCSGLEIFWAGGAR